MDSLGGCEFDCDVLLGAENISVRQRDVDLGVTGVTLKLGVAVVLGVASEDDGPLAEHDFAVASGIRHWADV